MINLWFLLASIATGFAVFVHVVLGGKLFITPFLENEIPEAQKWMSYHAWHAVSVSFVLMLIGFALAAFDTDHRVLGTASTLYAFSLILNGLFVCYRGSISPKTFPAIPMFSVITIIGLLGITQ